MLVDEIAVCKEVVAELLNEEQVAIDIEGIELGRSPGEICLIQICAASKKTNSVCYLFDITTLQDAAFDENKGNLRELLESTRVQKVFWDVRSDCDALHHNHKIRVQNAFDLQILYHLKFCGRGKDYLTGLKTAMSEFGKTHMTVSELHCLESLKEEGLRLFAPEHGGSYNVRLGERSFLLKIFFLTFI